MSEVMTRADRASALKAVVAADKELSFIAQEMTRHLVEFWISHGLDMYTRLSKQKVTMHRQAIVGVVEELMGERTGPISRGLKVPSDRIRRYRERNKFEIEYYPDHIIAHGITKAEALRWMREQKYSVKKEY